MERSRECCVFIVEFYLRTFLMMMKTGWCGSSTKTEKKLSSYHINTKLKKNYDSFIAYQVSKTTSNICVDFFLYSYQKRWDLHGCLWLWDSISHIYMSRVRAQLNLVYTWEFWNYHRLHEFFDWFLWESRKPLECTVDFVEL